MHSTRGAADGVLPLPPDRRSGTRREPGRRARRGLVDLLSCRSPRDPRAGSVDEATVWFEALMTELDEAAPGTAH